MRHLLLVVCLLIATVLAKAQNGTFIALDNTKSLYSIDVNTCNVKKLTFCNNFAGNPLSIALDGTTLYINDNRGNLYKNTLGVNGTVGNCTLIGQFLSKSTGINGLTVGTGGIVYAAYNNKIETYDPSTNTFGTLGTLPVSDTVSGDLLFYQGVLYEACKNKGNYFLVKVNLTNPGASTVFMNFNAGVNVFGFASVTVPCANNQSYAVSQTGQIYAVDLTNKTQSSTVKCALGLTIYDAASVAETIVDSRPPAPSNVVSNINLCNNQGYTFTVTPTVTAKDPNDTLRWYTPPSTTPRGTPIINTQVPSTTTYLVCQYNPTTQCESDSLPVTVVVQPKVLPPVTTISTPTCSAASSITVTSTAVAPNLAFSINGTNYFNPAVFPNLSQGVYSVIAKDTIYGCLSAPAYDSVNPQPPSPLMPTISPATICEQSSPTFTASNGQLYQFFKNGVAQTTVSANGTYSGGVISLKDTVCVRSYGVPNITFDGNITEAAWGPPIATSVGGPKSGFPTNPELNALYVRNNINKLYIALAGIVHNDERIILFIDSKTGGYNNGNFGRLNAPTALYDFRQGNKFDNGFFPDYALTIGTNPAENDYFFDLYTLSGTAGNGGGPNNYLGSGKTSPSFLGASPANGSFTKGFESAIFLDSIGYNPAFGDIKIMAMYLTNLGDISNQFITRANAGELDYGRLVDVDFSKAAPNPVAYSLSPNCYNEACVTVNAKKHPTFTPVAPFCSGSAVPTLPTTSIEGVTGTWNPSAIDNTKSSQYIFTQNGGECAIGDTINVVVTPKTVTTFTPVPPICIGAVAPILPNKSLEGVSGTWVPKVVDNQKTGIYNFTPDASECATTAQLTVTVGAKTTPTFDPIPSFCSGSVAPTLPNTSKEGFTGTWTPTKIDSLNSGSYQFTPDAGQCANNGTLNVSVTPKTKPSFTPIAAFCRGTVAPTLPVKSLEGITGTWLPAIIDTTISGVYKFTPDAGQCADTTSVSVTVNQKSKVTFSPIAAFCSGTTAPLLPSTSLEGIAGTWLPSTIDNAQTSDYVFTPSTALCANKDTISVIVTKAPLAPTANVVAPTCTVPSSITVTSTTNNLVFSIDGTNFNTTGVFNSVQPGVYNLIAKDTLTGCLSVPSIYSVSQSASLPLVPNITPSTICEGTSPTFTVSNGQLYQFFKNGVAQTTVSDTASFNAGTVTLKDTICVRSYSVPNITFDGNITESDWGLPIATSAGGPKSGFASKPEINALYVKNNIKKLYVALAGNVHNDERIVIFIDSKAGGYSDGNFGRINSPLGLYDYEQTNKFDNGFLPDYALTIGTNVAEDTYFYDLYTLSGTAGNGGGPNYYLGSNKSAPTYLGASPANGSNTKGFEMAVLLDSIGYNPSFGSIKLMAMYMLNLGNISNQFITRANAGEGDYGKGFIDFSKAAPDPVTYTFAPNCFSEACVSVNAKKKASFAPIAAFCRGSIAPALPTTSIEGINGTWSPATIDTTNSGSYIFTQNTGECAIGDTINVVVTPKTITTFNPIAPICTGAPAPVLPTKSNEGVTGTWTPNVVDNTQTATYIFTPAVTECATKAQLTINVGAKTTPTFDPIPSICSGSKPPILPTTSKEGFTGTWLPATIDSMNSGSYQFTPDAGQCANTASLNVSVTKTIQTSFDPIVPFCGGGAVPALPSTSKEGVTGIWSPAKIDSSKSGNYVFTPDAGICATTFTLAVTIKSTPSQPIANVVAPTCTAPSSISVTSTTSNLVFSIDGTNFNTTGVFTSVPPGVYQLIAKDTISGCISAPAIFSLSQSANLPLVPNLTPSTICEGSNPTFTVSNGLLYQFYKNGVAQTTVSDTATFSAGTITLKDTICVRSYAVPNITFDGNITESDWGLPIATSAGGPKSGFTSKPEINALYVKNNIKKLYVALAGNVHNDERVVIFIDSKTGGYSDGNFGRNNAPYGLYDFNQANKFDNGFQPDYALTIGTNPAEDTSFFDLFTLSGTAGSGGGPNYFIGNNLSNPKICGASPANGSNTKGFEVAFPLDSIAYNSSFGAIKLMAMYMKNDGTISNQFITRANVGEGDYGKVFVDFSKAAPDPVSYTFAPNCYSESCVTVNAKKKPSFPTIAPICSGGTVPVLPTISNEGVNGTWSPATIDNTTTADYHFTPNTGACAINDTITVTVTPKIAPTFAAIPSICSGTAAPILPTKSVEGIIGTWNPAVVDNTKNADYTFTPDAGQCAGTTKITITVTPTNTPTFTAIPSFCSGTTAPILPTKSIEGYTGTWSPALVDNIKSADYTFTPDAGQCAGTTKITVTVTPTNTPTFTAIPSFCSGSVAPILPTTSKEGIIGTWSPGTVDNTKTADYVFTPNAGQCAGTTKITVTVTPTQTPTFNSIPAICNGSVAPILPTTSKEGIIGTWSPTTVDNTKTAIYKFTPNAGQCAVTINITVTVTPLVTTTFAAVPTICNGSVAPVLPTTSLEGINGVWSPAPVDNTQTGTYTFIPFVGQCGTQAKQIVTVTPKATPTFNTIKPICVGTPAPLLPNTSNEGVLGSWLPATIENTLSGNYVFTPNINQCANPITLPITITQQPAVSFIAGPNEIALNQVYTLTNLYSGGDWTSVFPSIATIDKGNGEIKGVTPGVDTIHYTIKNDCGVASTDFVVKVLEPTVFIPNLFSPNGDGHNDKFYVRGNTTVYKNVELRIFDQWGNMIYDVKGNVDDASIGWDGKYKGKEQPTGVYIYVVKVTLANGETIVKKGTISLLK